MPSIAPWWREKLLAWYDAHRRDLPWRSTRNPYPIWLSEIMLQQTRVAAVIEHYGQFLRRFPTIEKLAAARESSVLAAWSGLGYYRRARMLRTAAKIILREHKGKFPTTAAGLRNLPGIGRYTAAAIASIAFGEPVGVVDGNVERMLCRFAGKNVVCEELWATVNVLIDAKRPGDFNQAMMELGATVCTPQAPACLACPVVERCATRGELARSEKPAPQKKREIHFSLLCRGANGSGKVFLRQRPGNASLMAGMWELPEVAARNGASKPAFRLRHSITVTDYSVSVWRECAIPQAEGRWFAISKLKTIALTGLARKILSKAQML